MLFKSRHVLFCASVFFYAILALVPAAYAADQAASSVQATSAIAQPTTTPSDKDSWKGDKVKLANDVKNIGDGQNGSNYFAPDGSIFMVTDDDETSHKITVKFLNIKTLPDSNGNKKVGLNSTANFMFWHKIDETPRDVPSASTSGPVDSHGLYTMDKAALEKMDYYRHGWAFGLLTVPYKYQLHDKSFGSALTIGPYVGYRFADQASSTTWVLTAGIVNNIPVPLANNTGTVNRSGFTLAVGWIFSINKGTGLEAGVLFGQDRLGSNAAAPYQYEGKTWASVAIGYKFL